MVMQILHIYWYGLFLRMLYRLITTGKQKDLVQDVTLKDEPQAKKTN